MKWSIGLRTQFTFFTAGSGGRAGGWNAQWSPPSVFSLAGALAPWSIQAVSRRIWAAGSGGFLNGMRVTPLAPLTASISRLSDALPGTTAGPLSPPLRRNAAVSTRSPPFLILALWQDVQCWARIGLTSRT